MTVPPDWVDPDDPYFESYSPSVGVATTALDQARERYQTAKKVVEDNLALNPDATNIVARSAKKSCATVLADMAAALARCEAAAEASKATTTGSPEHETAVHAATSALGDVSAALTEIEHPAAAILTPDIPLPPYVEPPLPPVQSWAAVSQQVHADTLAWGASVRSKTERMLILKPSPSVGKTEAMLDLALQEQRAGKRVVFASRTNEVLVSETETRFKNKSPFIPLRLHVIQGRNEDTCWNYDNVKAVQDHGYAPARSVCIGCQYHDRNAHFFNVSICPYYKSRIAANNDSKLAARKIIDPPIILTSHAGLLAAQNSGGGRLGRFWSADLILIDEDPTESMEPEIVITEDHAAYRSGQLEYKPADLMARLLTATIDLAKNDRSTSESFGFKESGKPSRSHSKIQSSYAGEDLHRLLRRVMEGPFGQGANLPLSSILIGAADAMRAPKVAELVGLQTTKAVNAILPPKCLSDLGAALHDELTTVERIGHRVYERVRGKQMPIGTTDEIATEKERNVELPARLSYRCRLECVKVGTGKASRWRWRFVVQDWMDLVDHRANIVVGDAYAHVEHYRQLFKKPATKPSDPNYADPVTVIDHIAKFPDGSLVVHWHTPAGITWLKSEGWQEHAAKLETLLPRFAGQRVLVYGHKDLKPRVDDLFEKNDNFGVAEWAYEYWYGGRGKDQYRHFDVVVCISDPIPNSGGLTHKVNARAWHDVEPARQAGDIDAQGKALTRVELDWNDMKTSLPRKMRDGRTHWRIRQEYERQGMNELAQAIHRVRGLISPKLMVVMGQQVELTRDTWAAAAVTDVEASKVIASDEWSFLTTQDALSAIEAVVNRYGVFSTAFLHIFHPLAVEHLLGLACGVPAISFNCVPKGDVRHTLCPANPTLECDEADRSDRSLRLIDRVWTPPARWASLAEQASGARFWKEIRKDVDGCYGYTGSYRPTWYPARGRGFVWWSRERADVGIKRISAILDRQYGPQRGGKLVTSGAVPF